MLSCPCIFLPYWCPKILNLFPCFPWPRILRSLCPRVTSCKMVTISFTLFIKSVQAHCLKAMRVFIKKAIPLPIYLVILKGGFELLPSDIWECCASFIACVFLKWTNNPFVAHPSSLGFFLLLGLLPATVVFQFQNIFPSVSVSLLGHYFGIVTLNQVMFHCWGLLVGTTSTGNARQV